MTKPTNTSLREEIAAKLRNHHLPLTIHADDSTGNLDHCVDAIESLLTAKTTEARYDTNRLGTYVFIGDNDRLKNLDDLYWSYVEEYVAANTADYDHYKLDYLKGNMEYAGFDEVGIRKLLATANQRAKERLEQLQQPDKEEK